MARVRLYPPPRSDRAAAPLHPLVSVPGYWDALETNCEDWAALVSASRFWRSAQHSMPSWMDEYRATTGSDLVASQALAAFVGKKKGRTEEKCRSSAAPLWPVETDPPVPALNDLVRTRIECKFLDGVTFLSEKLRQLAIDLGKQPKIEPKGRLEGYFAQHVYFQESVHFKFGGGADRPTVVTCEVQLATTLSTMVWETSHALYETRRTTGDDDRSWQWDANSAHFLANQLGHMIHLADGLLVKLRDASKKVPR
jgi:hypothetical protein